MKEIKDLTIEINRRYRKDHLSDFIGTPPNALLKSGITLIFFVTILILFTSYFISYPDIIISPVIITNANLPVPVYSNQSGIIDKIFVENGELVLENQKLLSITNTSNVSDVENWKVWLNYFDSNYIPDQTLKVPPVAVRLGELHSLYSTVTRNYYEWSQLLQDPSKDEKIKALKLEKETIGNLSQSLVRQMEIFNVELSLLQKNVSRDEALLASGVISALEYEKTKSIYLVSKRLKETLISNILNNDLQIARLNSQINEESSVYRKNVLAIYTNLKGLCRQALDEINIWEEKYCIKSKITGFVVMPTTVNEKLYITSGDIIFNVVPRLNTKKAFATALVSSSDLGRIEIGNKTIIRLDSWPYKQFGSIISKVNNIAIIPNPNADNEKNYEITMTLSMPLETTIGVQITPKPEEIGQVRIITKERRILDRIFNKLFHLSNLN